LSTKDTIDKLLDFNIIAKFRKNTFVRSLMVSVVATLTDYLVSLILHHIFLLREVWSTALGSASGAVVSFYLNRRWAFKSSEGKLSKQAFRYIVTLGIGICLNSIFVYFLSEYTSWPFILMRIVATVSIGVAINYPLYKYFVFKSK
jgi:putative flippase GtrA